MNTHHAETEHAADVLRAKGFRVTRGRVGLLSLLQKSGKPLSIQSLLKAKGSPDQATLYRTLTDLADAGIVKRVDLNTGVAHFEYTPDRPHHHHIVCTDCGTIEDIETCSIESLQRQALRSSGFKTIYSHTVDFFGVCKNCS